MTSTTPLPAPAHLSEQARQFLANPRSDTPYPARDDVAGWQQLSAGIEAYIVAMFAGVQLPVTQEDTEIAGVRTYVLQPHGVAADGPLVIDLHGGGLIFGGGKAAAITGSVAAVAHQMTTWSVDYRMPPLHLYPAALDDCFAVYRAALEVRDPADVFLLGGSAGGNLAAATLLRAKDEGVPMPAALVLKTPEVDLTESGDTFTVLDGVDNMLGSLAKVNELYADGADLAHPYLSPLFGDLAGFPPTLLQSGTRDLFLSNTVRMHRRLLAAGVQAELHVFEAMPHGGFGGSSPEDAELDETIRGFIARHRRA